MADSYLAFNTKCVFIVLSGTQDLFIAMNFIKEFENPSFTKMLSDI